MIRVTDLSRLTEALHSRIEWQKTPEEVYREDLTGYVVLGIKDLYIMTGRAAQYTDELFEYEDGVPIVYKGDLPADEEEYVLTVAQINFFNKVKTDVNNHVGYTTDALSVTHADKPYRYLSETIGDLEQRKRILWFKMGRYTIL